MKRRLVLAAMLFVTLCSGGCSVYMAAKGEEEPNLSNVRRGASRGQIEMASGQPKSLVTHDDGKLTANYEYVVGDEPSTGRAVGHGVMDVLTLGLWEVVGTPIEALNQGDTIKVTVLYDKAGNALQIQSSKL
jgi:hypothetical protein